MGNEIRYGAAEIITKLESGISLIKFRGRYYTTYGRMFAVAGNHVATPYDKVCKMKHYDFTDWNKMENMYTLD